MGSCMERENVHGDAKGKGARGRTTRPKYDAPVRGGCESNERGMGGAKGAGHRHWRGSTGNGRNPLINGRRQPSCDGTSRISRETYVRLCERLGVKSPGSTWHQHRFKHTPRTSTSPPIPGHIAASHRSATKSADARRGAAHAGELRQAAGAVASVATDKRGVTRSQPQIYDGPPNALSVAKAKSRSSFGGSL